jgi:hypothetical protein
MKRYNDFIWTLISMICYALCGVIWLYKGLFQEKHIGWFNVAVGLVWLSGAVIWAVRTGQNRKEIKANKIV